jgi:uncharacterized protein
MSNVKSKQKGRPSPAARPANLRSYGDGPSAPPTVSAKWLLSAGMMAIVGALFCAWGTLCFLFWQGNWQLLYHPASAVTRTPASVNLPFDSVGFATNPAGDPQLRGWWIPASSQPHFTAIYLHGADGNLGNTVDELARLHASGLNVFAFDYRGYGPSRFAHPSEARWSEDAGSAIGYLTGTRHIAVNTIILVGKDLGANLAIETAAAHPDLAGIVLEQPLASPALAIFSDARAHLVPAHWLVSDRWQTSTAAGNILIPSLWFYWTAERNAQLEQRKLEAYEKVPARKMLVWLPDAPGQQEQFRSALSSWLDQLPAVAR